MLSPKGRNKNCVLVRCERQIDDDVDIERLCSRTVDLGALRMKLRNIIAHDSVVHSCARLSTAHFYLVWTTGLVTQN